MMRKGGHFVGLLSLLLLLNGCTALAIGGAGAAGYYVGTDERSAGQIAEDAAITSSVKTRLIADDYVPAFKINVDTHESIVYLRGEVVGHDIARRAVDIARRTGGVKRVVNELRVVPASYN